MPAIAPAPSIQDFRRNADRQRREQRATVTLLSTAGYVVLGLVLLFAGLASFGGYVLYRQIQNQSVTVAQIDAKYADKVSGLEQDLQQAKKTIGELTALNKQQQDRIAKLVAANEAAAGELRGERDNRVKELEKITKRLQKLETRSGAHAREADASTPAALAR
ncbi:MAG: hypothetical protein JO317_06275 [Verrucomicrobiae bacterium]|nr:hypothetical protein [Verrucomicrobiae bacterium]